jgi:cell wall-associated NlpC family hydrolase
MQIIKNLKIRDRNLVILVMIILAIAYCRVRTEPEKVWNLRGKMTALAKSLVGLPYRYGGEEINGFDCSGLVYYVYDCFGIKLPRTAKKQSQLDGKIKLKYAEPADILVFKFKGRRHTAIYIGDNIFIHAPNRKSRVRRERLTKAWKRRLKYVISIIDE